MLSISTSFTRSRLGSRVQRGFTLIELMIVVAIIAILAAVAYPSYRDYVLRGRVAEGTAGLQTLKADMERHYQNNRDYRDISSGAASPCTNSRTVGTFTLSCNGTPTLTTFSVQAEGDGFTFTVNERNVRATTAGPWGTCASAWTLKRGQTC